MADLDDLLRKTSRTFGISIPLLPKPTRREVTIAYLLFRIADTLEDGHLWPPAQRVCELNRFARLLASPGAGGGLVSDAARWLADPPSDHPGYLELLGQTPLVFAELESLPDEARERIRRHLIRTVQGMASYVERAGANGELRLCGLRDLRQYCYVVAGIVGEMLTDLFALVCPALEIGREEMMERARLFGEGLQLVNILKDSQTDAREGRWYLPAELDFQEVLELARDDLEAGRHYILSLQGGRAPKGFLAFVALPLALAQATLERVEAKGPGSKVSREEVGRILGRITARFANGTPDLTLASLRELRT